MATEFPPWPLKNPCKACGAPAGGPGYLKKVGDQNCLRCAQCDTYNGFNVPKRETGEPQRHVSSRPGIKPGQRARILERDGYRCKMCGKGADQSLLHIGHLLSVADAELVGAPDEILWCDGNLYTACEECNLGQGSRSVDPILIFLILKAKLAREKM